MFAGRLLGDVLIAEVPPLLPRSPKPGGAALGDASRGAYWGSVALEKDGDTLARKAA